MGVPIAKEEGEHFTFSLIKWYLGNISLFGNKRLNSECFPFPNL